MWWNILIIIYELTFLDSIKLLQLDQLIKIMLCISQFEVMQIPNI